MKNELFADIVVIIYHVLKNNNDLFGTI